VLSIYYMTCEKKKKEKKSDIRSQFLKCMGSLTTHWACNLYRFLLSSASHLNNNGLWSLSISLCYHSTCLLNWELVIFSWYIISRVFNFCLGNVMTMKHMANSPQGSVLEHTNYMCIVRQLVWTSVWSSSELTLKYNIPHIESNSTNDHYKTLLGRVKNVCWHTFRCWDTFQYRGLI
jgi:hypothetical protein